MSIEIGNGPYNGSLRYKIVNFYPNTGQIEIECEGYDRLLSIDLPIDNGRYPEGDDLDIYIRGFIPTWLIERQRKLREGVINQGSLQSIVNDHRQQQKENQQRNFNVGEVYATRQRLLQESDWTQLPDAPLSDVQRKLWADYRQQLRDITMQPLTPDMKWPTKPDILGIVYFIG